MGLKSSRMSTHCVLGHIHWGATDPPPGDARHHPHFYRRTHQAPSIPPDTLIIMSSRARAGTLPVSGAIVARRLSMGGNGKC